jgi:hypothetical protein
MYDLTKWDLHVHDRTDNHPILKHTCVKVVAHIRDNATGEVRQYQTWEIYDPEDGEHPGVFNWEENNYSCNCNRALFFARSIGADEPDVDCGDGKYSVNLANAKTGEIYYREFD